MNTENKILFDWLTFTVVSDDFGADDALDFLGLKGYPFQRIYGMHGYKDRYYLNGINVYYNGRDDMGVCVEMSGSGCRFFEENGKGDILSIIEFIFENPNMCHISRLDIAYDDFYKLLDLDLICDDVRNGNWVSRFRKITVEQEFSKKQKNDGTTIYFGSKKSDILFRLYDKRAERGRDDIEHWARFEIQLRDERAECFAQMLYCGNDINELFRGVVYNYLRFVRPSDSDTNISRAPMTDYWETFLQSVSAVRLTKQGTDYNESNLYEYVVKQTMSASSVFVDLFGLDLYVNLLELRSQATLNQKYMNLLAKYGLEGGEYFERTRQGFNV